MLFHSGLKLLTIFNKHTGKEIRNIFLDSLGLEYAALAKTLFVQADYESSYRIYMSNKDIQNMPLIRPDAIFKVSSTHLGILYSISSFRDTVYKKDSVISEQAYSFVLLSDLSFQKWQLVPFNDGGKFIVTGALAAYVDSALFVYRYHLSQKAFYIAKYQHRATGFILTEEYPEPRASSKDGALPYMSTIHNFIYITYFPRAHRTCVYQFFHKTKLFQKIVYTKKLKIAPAFIYKNSCGHFVFLTREHNIFRIKEFFPEKEVFINIPECFDIHMNHSKDLFYFVFDGFLYGISASK